MTIINILKHKTEKEAGKESRKEGRKEYIRGKEEGKNISFTERINYIKESEEIELRNVFKFP